MSPDTRLHFVHISDTHLLAPGHQRDFAGIAPELALYAQQIRSLPHHPTTATEALIREIRALPLPVDFVLHTGDVAGEANVDYAFLAQIFARIGYPVVYVPGNHDLSARMTPLGSREIDPVAEYDFNGVQVVCLDSSRYGTDHAGWLDDAQLACMQDICASADERPLIVATHHHPVPVDVPWLDALRLLNGAALHEILLGARQRLRGVFFGHIHHSVDIVRDGILYSSVASAFYQFTGWPGHAQASLDMAADPGFNVVTVTGRQTFVRHHRFRIVP